MSEEDVFGLLVDAYQAGALDVHQNWQADRDPCFAEAAHDYARAALAIEALQPTSQSSSSSSRRLCW